MYAKVVKTVNCFNTMEIFFCGKSYLKVSFKKLDTLTDIICYVLCTIIRIPTYIHTYIYNSNSFKNWKYSDHLYYLKRLILWKIKQK